MNEKTYGHIETWRICLIYGDYSYVYVDGVYLKRSLGGELRNVSVLIAICVSRVPPGDS